NGQNYYPHDLEAVLQKHAGAEIGGIVATAGRRAGSESDEILLFVVHRGPIELFAPRAAMLAGVIAEHVGIEVAKVLPIQRIPKTTSGKVQRHVLAAQYAAGEFDAQIALLADLRAAREGGAAPSSEIEEKLIELLGRLGSASRVGVHDNLFEIGFS